MDSDTVTITHDAARRVRHIIDTRGDPDLKLRVYVQGGGCSGFQYGFQLEEQQGDDDFTIEEDGVTVLVDALSYQYLMGSEIDFKNDLQGARFMVKNPNASATCGCGSSFSI